MSRTAISRFITGLDDDGEAIIETADTGTNIKTFESLPGLYITELWATDENPADNGFQGDRAIGAGKTLGPTPNGTVFRMIEMPPEKEGAADLEVFKALGDESVRSDSTRHPSMHKTKTIDYITMVRGEMTLIMEKGEVVLRPGDTAILRGHVHGWANRGTETALYSAVLIDALP